MKIKLLTVTHKCPNWVQEGFAEYSRRLPQHCQIELIEIPAEKRSNNANLEKIAKKESEKILSAIDASDHVVALEITGKQWKTEDLAKELSQWQQSGSNIALLVGGPEGLDASCQQRANQTWSLSALTFPHFLVRVIIAEQIYRAHTILTNHPYHR